MSTKYKTIKKTVVNLPNVKIGTVLKCKNTNYQDQIVLNITKLASGKDIYLCESSDEGFLTSFTGRTLVEMGYLNELRRKKPIEYTPEDKEPEYSQDDFVDPEGHDIIQDKQEGEIVELDLYEMFHNWDSNAAIQQTFGEKINQLVREVNRLNKLIKKKG